MSEQDAAAPLTAALTAMQEAHVALMAALETCGIQGRDARNIRRLGENVDVAITRAWAAGDALADLATVQHGAALEFELRVLRRAVGGGEPEAMVT